MSTITEHPTSTPLTRLIRDNIQDLYDPEIGVKQAPDSILEQLAEIFSDKDDPDSSDFLLFALTCERDFAEFFEVIKRFIRSDQDFPLTAHELSLFVKDALIGQAQNELNKLEGVLEEAYWEEEASWQHEGHAEVHSNVYEFKKGE